MAGDKAARIWVKDKGKHGASLATFITIEVGGGRGRGGIVWVGVAPPCCVVYCVGLRCRRYGGNSSSSSSAGGDGDGGDGSGSFGSHSRKLSEAPLSVPAFRISLQ